MTKINIKEGAGIVYQRTTFQGVVEINGETITYRYSEDDNGVELYVFTEKGWQQADTTKPNYAILDTVLMEYGLGEMFSDGECIEIDDELIKR
jgi:hypothetical protein